MVILVFTGLRVLLFGVARCVGVDFLGGLVCVGCMLYSSCGQDGGAAGVLIWVGCMLLALVVWFRLALLGVVVLALVGRCSVVLCGRFEVGFVRCF